MALNLVMLGPPGAGKGTQAERLSRGHRIPKVSTGDILREAVHSGTTFSSCVKALMDRGELVGDDVMIGIVRERIDQADARHGFVLDGFPRTVAQATALDAIMDARGPLIVVDIVVSEVELMRRLGSRLICEDCGANAGGFADSAAAGVAVPDEVVGLRPTTDPRRCLRCGGGLVQRTDDSNLVVMERLKVYYRQTEPLVEFYRQRPTFRSIDGMQPADRVAADLAAAIEAARGGDRR